MDINAYRRVKQPIYFGEFQSRRDEIPPRRM